MRLADLLPEKEIKKAVLSEYEKRFALFKLTDEKFRKKYGMSVQDFEKKSRSRKGFFMGYRAGLYELGTRHGRHKIS